jgi:hypothetical protein
MITFLCKHCGHKLAVKDELAGKTGKCPKCGKPSTVPGADSDTNGGGASSGGGSSWGAITSSEEPASKESKSDPRTPGRPTYERPARASKSHGFLIFTVGLLLGIILGGIGGIFAARALLHRENPGKDSSGDAQAKADGKAPDKKKDEPKGDKVKPAEPTEPKSEEPAKNEEAKGDAPKKEEPAKKEEPKKDEAKMAAKVEPPKPEAPKAEPPKPAAAKAEPPKPAVAKPEPPKPAVAKADPPKKEEPAKKPEPVKKVEAKPAGPQLILGEVDMLGKDSGGLYVELRKNGLLMYRCYYKPDQAAVFAKLVAKQAVKIKGVLKNADVIETYSECQLVK